jgi:hypothetical protein
MPRPGTNTSLSVRCDMASAASPSTQHGQILWAFTTEIDVRVVMDLEMASTSAELP